jgi:hypothetical protein
MVPALELTNEDALEHLKKILKGVSIILHPVLEYYADNPPPAVSCFFFCEYFTLYISFVASTFISLTLLLFLSIYRIWVRISSTRSLWMTPPSGAKIMENLARGSSTNKFQSTTILPGASVAETIPYVEYVPRPVP